MREEVFQYALQKYKDEPDQPFFKFPTYQALRHADNRKIYALIMDVKRGKLGIQGEPDVYVDILNVKCTENLRWLLTSQPGFLPSYHMRAGNWISILLDGTVSFDQVCELLDLSYDLTGSKPKSRRNILHNSNWIVPANPRYYDIEKAISEGDVTFLWKQSNTILAGDMVYLYVAAPISAIKYQCKVLEADIPYPYSDENVSMKKAMRLHVLHTFDNTAFPIQRLKTFGVTTVRGPRSIPEPLLQELRLASDSMESVNPEEASS